MARCQRVDGRIGRKIDRLREACLVVARAGPHPKENFSTADRIMALRRGLLRTIGRIENADLGETIRLTTGAGGERGPVPRGKAR